MAPCVIGVKLQAMPCSLAEVHLEGIVVRVPLCHCVTGTNVLHVRVGLEIVDRISRARRVERTRCKIIEARKERAAYEVAEVRDRAIDASQDISRRTGLARHQLGNERSCRAVVSEWDASTTRSLPEERSVKDR